MTYVIPQPPPRTFVSAVRNRVEGTRLFIPIRSCFRAAFRRDRVREHRQMRQFYRQFITRGDLVFDVGAAVGEYAEAFCGLGARVIAIEPNPARCETLFKLSRLRDIRVEGCAVGSAAGAAELHLCAEANFSTLAQRWVDRANDVGSGEKWLGSIEVPVTTLDAIAKRHGQPSFIKIDVEGYEEPALRGMSFQPKALSFEFSLHVPEAASACLKLPILQDYEFNAIAGRDFVLSHGRWLSASQMIDWIAGMGQVDFEYGDVFARRT